MRGQQSTPPPVTSKTIRTLVSRSRVAPVWSMSCNINDVGWSDVGGGGRRMVAG